jgi:hypothetical protein
MKALKRIALVFCAYVALVAAFETFVSVMGRQHAARGVAEGDWALALTTTGTDGARRDAVVAGVEVDGHLYVAANHWPRAWYVRAVAQPDVAVKRGGDPARPFRAAAVTGAERSRVVAAYRLPLFMRALTGFPPRRFLRLDPR